ncbi:MAG: T9SS type A sorting domain-containing protein [Bacteroidota bacterium]
MKSFIKNTSLIAICLMLLASATAVRSQTTDMGVAALLAPANPLCGGLNDVIIVITNYGTVDVNSLNIDWSVNGNPQTQLSYIQTILSGESDTLNLGQFDFPSGITSSITFFTSSPNGGTDDDPTNDTLTVGGLASRFAAGSYTIGGNSPDFARITDAVTAISTYGICGAVIFEMRSGIDTVRFAIPAINGADASNTITFRSEAMNSDSVKLTAPSANTPGNPNYVVRLDGADHITFEYLTLERSGIEPYARVIEFRGGACFNTISHCTLKGSDQNQVANSLAAVVYSSFGTPTNDSNFTITENTILNGSIGVYMNGLASLNPETGGVISDNTFTNQYGRGIAVSNQGSLLISGNTIASASAYAQYTGIELDRSQRNQLVEKNRVSGNVDIGINMIDCSGYNGTPGIVSNNFIQSSDSIGVRMDNGEYQLIAYNSVNLINSATGPALKVSGTGLGNEIWNNILCNKGAGPAADYGLSATVGIARCNHNDLYSAGSVLGVFNGANSSDLAAWKSASSADSNSVSADPYFSSVTDLYPSSIILDGAALPISQVLDDIDGNVRDLTAPDIGAAEFSGTRHDLSATAVIAPSDGSCGSNTATVTVIITNVGDASESGFTWSVNSSATGDASTQTYAGVLAPGASDTLYASSTFNTSAGGAIDLHLSVDADRDDDRTNDTLSNFITITPIPAAPIATADSVCLGETSTLTATGAGAIDWYAASTGGSLIATGNTYSPSILSASTTYYASTVVNGCESTRSAVTATILPLPLVSLGSDQSIIQGNTATFDAGASFDSYLWNNGATTQSITVSDSGCYQVVVTNSFGCSATDEACLSLVFPTDMYVNAVLSPITGLCASSSTPVIIQLVNNGPNVATNIPINIVVSGNTTGTLSTSVPGPLAPGDSIQVNMGNINTAAGGNVVLDVTVSYNAEADPSNDNFSDTAFTPIQPALPSTSNSGRCGAGGIILSATASLTVLWYDTPTGGAPIFAGNSYTINNLTQTTTYYLQNGTFCIGQDRQPVTATIYSNPSIYLGPDTATPSPVVLLDAGSGFLAYNWNTGESTQTITTSQFGDYWVTVTDQNGCTASDTISVVFTVGIDHDNILRSLRMYPNPASGFFTLDIPAGDFENLSLEIVGMEGNSIRTEKIISNGKGTSHIIDCTGLSKGIYMVRVSTKTSSGALRLVLN